jgi:uncharacterized protein DUF2785
MNEVKETMDKEFWISISEGNFQIPNGQTLENLTEILFSFLGSTDPELRDDIAYVVYANWLKREMYSRETVGTHVDRLLSNLDQGIGETETDTVFLRAFSILFLAEIVHNDNKKPLLDKKTIKSLLEKGLWYLEAENDPRGHIPVKGWAHALAHTADLMLVLARHRSIGEAELWSMLAAISRKIVHSNHYVYIHGEDERLASAVIEILRRDLISLNQLDAWTKSFTRPDGKDWKGVYIDEERNRAFQNTRNLWRSIYLALHAEPEDFPDRDGLLKLFLNTVMDLKPY